MTDREVSWGRCRYCGKFYRNLTEPVCKTCYSEMGDHSRKDPVRYDTRFKVVADPLPFVDGGYRPGAGFSTDEHRANIRWEAYTPGTVILDTKRQETITI